MFGKMLNDMGMTVDDDTTHYRQTVVLGIPCCPVHSQRMQVYEAENDWCGNRELGGRVQYVLWECKVEGCTHRVSNEVEIVWPDDA